MGDSQERYFCEKCGRELAKRETFLEPFTCAPERYTRCCRTETQFTPVITRVAEIPPYNPAPRVVEPPPYTINPADADLLDAGIVLTPERLVTTWSYNDRNHQALLAQQALRQHDLRKLCRRHVARYGQQINMLKYLRAGARRAGHTEAVARFSVSIERLEMSQYHWKERLRSLGKK